MNPKSLKKERENAGKYHDIILINNKVVVKKVEKKIGKMQKMCGTLF
ncbi:hypothetical protein [Bacillus thermotolerans]|nr:hypothetical protein [Bacillus thermotolerans]KKB33227.1 hypothetical protein QY97_03630 [Bacillus thermotolerans]KKB43119.1 hypothetical protein QY96_01006 [Bacillus thermotolerans]